MENLNTYFVVKGCKRDVRQQIQHSNNADKLFLFFAPDRQWKYIVFSQKIQSFFNCCGCFDLHKRGNIKWYRLEKQKPHNADDSKW